MPCALGVAVIVWDPALSRRGVWVVSGGPQGLTDEERQWARVVWDYHLLGHPVESVDVAIGLGSHDLGVPAYCAELYRAGLFSTLVFTGGPNPTAPGRFPRGEAVHFAEHAEALGVPRDAIVVEPHARNTGENIRFSRDALHDAGITASSVLLVSMPYMERRSYATSRKVWPEVDVACASAPCTFDDYLKTMDDERLVVDMLIGDLQRVIEYPARGFAIEQDLPPHVLHAYQALIAAGFDSRLLKT